MRGDAGGAADGTLDKLQEQAAGTGVAGTGVAAWPGVGARLGVAGTGVGCWDRGWLLHQSGQGPDLGHQVAATP